MAAEVLDGETVSGWYRLCPAVPALTETITRAGSDGAIIPNAPQAASLAATAAAGPGASLGVEVVRHQAGPVPLPAGAE